MKLFSLVILSLCLTACQLASDATDSHASIENTKTELIDVVDSKVGAPVWLNPFLEFFTKENGCWIAGNSQYTSDVEKAQFYATEWFYAIAKNGKRGRLYAWENGLATQDFWEFHIFWDGENQEVRTQQFGHNGVVGQGELREMSNNMFEQIQNLSLPDGRQWKDKHLIEIIDDSYKTTSYDFKNDSWIESRSYLWSRCN